MGAYSNALASTIFSQGQTIASAWTVGSGGSLKFNDDIPIYFGTDQDLNADFDSATGKFTVTNTKNVVRYKRFRWNVLHALLKQRYTGASMTYDSTNYWLDNTDTNGFFFHLNPFLPKNCIINQFHVYGGHASSNNNTHTLAQVGIADADNTYSSITSKNVDMTLQLYSSSAVAHQTAMDTYDYFILSSQNTGELRIKYIQIDYIEIGAL